MGKEYTRTVNIFGTLPVAGPIIFADNFENLLNWEQVGAVGDFIFELDPTIALFGSQSLYMKTRTTAAARNDVILARSKHHLLPSKIISFMGSFLLPTPAHTLYLLFRFEWHFNSKAYEVQIEYRPDANNDWAFSNHVPTFVTIPGSTGKLEANAWHTFILRANLNIGRYISLQIDHEIFDLSAEPLYYPGSSSGDHLLIDILLKTSGANPTSVNLGQIVLFEL